MKTETYYESEKKKKTKQLNYLLEELPKFCTDYFSHIDQNTSINTQVAYAENLLLFFDFLIEKNPIYKEKLPREIQIQDICRLAVPDIEEYKRYLKVYEKDGHEITNAEKSIARKRNYTFGSR